MFDDRPAGEPADAASNETEPAGPGFWASAREFVVILVVAVGLTSLLHNFVVQSNYVPSPSMSDTLKVDDKLLVSRVATRVDGVRRGEIVVFADPGLWVSGIAKPQGFSRVWHNVLVTLRLADGRNQLVKRVVGLPGDRVRCCDGAGRIVVNGTSLTEPYVKGARSDQLEFDIIVPKGRVFVLGDNRGDSRDSRYHLDTENGSVPIENIIGRVVMRIWPLGRVSRLEVPDSFASVPQRKPGDVPSPAPTRSPSPEPMVSDSAYIPKGTP